MDDRGNFHRLLIDEFTSTIEMARFATDLCVQLEGQLENVRDRKFNNHFTEAIIQYPGTR